MITVFNNCSLAGFVGLEDSKKAPLLRPSEYRNIIEPQALRIATPGITNDFIALFKDSSLVSVIAMVELTKTYSILAATTLRFFELGLIVACLYFVISCLPIFMVK